LLSILSACTGRPVAALESEFSGKGYGDFKKTVADAVVATLDPVRIRYDELIKDKGELARILKAGAEQAQATAFRTLSKVHRKVGFVERPR
ncbi:MAG: tryptophan--tRNA ligase, partial [Verrucomicrobiota bacterium]